jgi:hypothetical protein
VGIESREVLCMRVLTTSKGITNIQPTGWGIERCVGLHSNPYRSYSRIAAVVPAKRTANQGVDPFWGVRLRIVASYWFVPN